MPFSPKQTTFPAGVRNSQISARQHAPAQLRHQTENRISWVLAVIDRGWNVWWTQLIVQNGSADFGQFMILRARSAEPLSSDGRDIRACANTSGPARLQGVEIAVPACTSNNLEPLHKVCAETGYAHEGGKTGACAIRRLVQDLTIRVRPAPGVSEHPSWITPVVIPSQGRQRACDGKGILGICGFPSRTTA